MTDVVNSVGWSNGNADHNGNLTTDDEWEAEDSSSKMYERFRIQALADERENVQRKTFTKWINSHLLKVNQSIEDLNTDLRDGKMLLLLLEILSGERLPNPTKGKMRIHCLENVDKSLNFLLEQRVHMENVGAHDIVDGNSRLTLGLIWTVILRFQIQDIIIEEVDSSEKRQAKDALLLWCQMKTAGYQNTNVRNFTSCWKDGLAFNALIHKHRPDLVDYANLRRSTPQQNLESAFRIAETELGIKALLDPEDVLMEQPDEKSVMTYVVSLYHALSRMHTDGLHAKRVGKLLLHSMETQDMMDHYEDVTTTLLDWVHQTCDLLNDRSFANSLSGVQQQLAAFNAYRVTEKPPHFVEKGNLEMLLFSIQSRLRANNHRPYSPRNGRLLSDINSAWLMLERAEHARELALRDELIRQEKLEQLALRFERKAGMREAWLSENQRIIAQDNFGCDLASLDAAAKKHAAITTDILAYEERVNSVTLVATELENECYHDLEMIVSRRNNVLKLWENLLAVLANRKLRLNASYDVQKSFTEITHLLDLIGDLKLRLKTDDLGLHLMGVEDLLQKHSLLETDIKIIGSRIDNIAKESEQYEKLFEEENFHPIDPKDIQDRMSHLKEAYDDLLEIAKSRKEELNASKIMWEFLWDEADEEQWMKEKIQLMNNPDLGHDLSSVYRLISKHKVIEEDVRKHAGSLERVMTTGKKIIETITDKTNTDKVTEHLNQLQKLWNCLIEATENRRSKIEQSLSYFHCLADCNETDIWISEQIRRVTVVEESTSEEMILADIGKHEKLEQTFTEYETNIESIQEQVKKLEEGDLDIVSLEEMVKKIHDRFQELLSLSETKKTKLQDNLSLYRMMRKVDTIKTWIEEKEKLLASMIPSDEIEELEVFRHRFVGLEKEMNTQADQVETVNTLAERLELIQHPRKEDVADKRFDLNKVWNSLADLVESRREQLQISYQYNQFLLECKQTGEWIKEKSRLVESTDDLGDDLTGIMQLQRKMCGFQRDMDAIRAKLEHLDTEVAELVEKRPGDVELIKEERAVLEDLWLELGDILADRHDRLSESSELQRFLQDLDHIHVWLSRMQTTVASEDMPKDLADAEKSLVQHEQFQEEIESYRDEFRRLLEYGRSITEGETDAQYMFLNQRLNALEEGWHELKQMWENRQGLLSQSLSLQVFLRDAVQAEVLLAQEENFLTKEDIPISIENAQNLLRKHEGFLTTLQANHDHTLAVIEFGENLMERGHFATDKIRLRVKSIVQRRESNKRRSTEAYEKLKDQVLIQELNQDVEDLEEWVQEKMMVAVDESFRDEKNIAKRYNKHRAFEEEIDANKDRFSQVIDYAAHIVEERPHLKEYVFPKIELLSKQWQELEDTTHQKGEKMIEANREAIFDEGSSDVMTWLETVGESIIVTEEEIETLTDVNVKLKKVDEADTEMEVKRKQIQDLKMHAEKLKIEQPEKAKEIDEKNFILEQRFTQLQMPIKDKKQSLIQKKRIQQFLRNLQDQLVWTNEKLILAESTNFGNNLLTVQQLLRRHRYLTTEVANHKGQLDMLKQECAFLIEEVSPLQKEKFLTNIQELEGLWNRLEHSIDLRQKRLRESEATHTFLFDAEETEAWLWEQELFLLSEERGIRDQDAALNAIKKHDTRQKTIEDYGEEIKKLGERSSKLMETDHPQSDRIAISQGHVDKVYAGLRDLCLEKKQRLSEIQKLNHLYKEIMDLENWIFERTIVASSHDLGVDLEHCCLLRDRFTQFQHETESIGRDRVSAASKLCESLINQCHADSAEIAHWHDRINEGWADLVELIQTRQELLHAAWELYKYLSSCQDVLDTVCQKTSSIPLDGCKDSQSIAVQQRKHATFMSDIAAMETQVQWVVNEANRLLPSYAGQKEWQICEKRDDVIAAWNQLNLQSDRRRFQLEDASDLQRFNAMIRELMQWMDLVALQITEHSKPKDVSSVELLINHHRSVKAEIAARQESISICINLGRTLLHRGRVDLDSVRTAIINLITRKIDLDELWQDRWDHLQLILEVYQFARDAAVAEAWLFAQEPYLTNRNLGDTLDETLALLKKHVNFEKTLQSQEERFDGLRKMTTLEINSLQRYENAEDEEREKNEKQAKKQKEVEMATREFQPPPPTMLAEMSHLDLDESGQQSQQPHEKQDEKVGKDGEDGQRTSLAEERGESAARKNVDLSNIRGVLGRKHEWENKSKKASNRSWHELFAVIVPDTRMIQFYKDERHWHERPAETYHRESGIELTDVTAAPATDYSKRQNVFRVKSVTTGAEYLFQTKDAADLNKWVSAINSVMIPPTIKEPSPDPPSQEQGLPTQHHIAPATKSSTLPTRSSHTTPQTQSEAASGSSSQMSGFKRKFFTLTRKK